MVYSTLLVNTWSTSHQSFLKFLLFYKNNEHITTTKHDQTKTSLGCKYKQYSWSSLI